jgi:hypothetical protein
VPGSRRRVRVTKRRTTSRDVPLLALHPGREEVLLIRGGIARSSGNAMLPRMTPPAGPFWRRHGLVGLLLLAGAWVLLVLLACPAHASPGEQDTTSSAGSSDRQGETSQTSDSSTPHDSASDDSSSASDNGRPGSASDDQNSDTRESSGQESPGDTATGRESAEDPASDRQDRPDSRSATGTEPSSPETDPTPEASKNAADGPAAEDAPSAPRPPLEDVPTVETQPAAMPPTDRAGTADSANSDPVVTGPPVNGPSRADRDDRAVAPAGPDPAGTRDRAAAERSPVPVTSEAEENPEPADISARPPSATATRTYPSGIPTTRAQLPSDSPARTMGTRADARSTNDPAPSAHLTSALTPVTSVVFSSSPYRPGVPPDSGYNAARTASRSTGASGWAQSEPERRSGAMWSTREPITLLSPVRPLTPPVPLIPPASSAPTPGTFASGSGSGTGQGEHLDDLAILASSGAAVLVQASARIASGSTNHVVGDIDGPRGRPG